MDPWVKDLESADGYCAGERFDRHGTNRQGHRPESDQLRNLNAASSGGTLSTALWRHTIRSSRIGSSGFIKARAGVYALPAFH